VSLDARPLSGRRVLVTGGARRIGRAIALQLAEAGAEVGITFRGSDADAQHTVDALRKVGARAFAVNCDVRDEASVNEAVFSAVEQLGGLDVLVNNAGTFETAVLQEISVAQWDAMFETNTRGPFLVAKAAYPHLKASRGRIVNIGSLGGIHPWATHGHYCTSKAALHMLSQTMVVMGEVDPAYEHFAAKTPMGRNGTPADVAAAVLFFAAGPHFITGQLLAVDGGLGL